MNDSCKNCGATYGLHHFETEQCPVGGFEAPIGHKQWMATTFVAQNNEVAELRNVNQLLTRIGALENLVEVMQSKSENNCKDCKFCEDLGVELGRCRHNPPSLGPHKWPQVSIRDDWCGRFEPRQESEYEPTPEEKREGADWRDWKAMQALPVGIQ